MIVTARNEQHRVKRAIISAGFDQNALRVTHGQGTARGLLTVHAKIHHAPVCTCVIRQCGTRETGEECKKKWADIYNLLIDTAMRATGRHGEYDGQIGVNLDFFTDMGEAP